jgi:hypothetical protein
MKINWRLIILFIITMGISQLLVKLLSPNNFLTSPMYILLPLVSFFATYYFSEYIMNYIEVKNKYFFAGLFVLFSLIAFYIVLFIFFWNSMKILSNVPISFPYIKILLDSAFIEFIVAGILGIIGIKNKKS